jgi:PKD repeat protein
MKRLFLFTFLLWNSFYEAQNLLTGLQACYPLDGNTNNYASTGASLNGTPVNVTLTLGHAATAYSFSGDTTSYITLPSDSRIRPATELTFSGWIYIGALPSQQYVVYTKNNCSFNFEGYSLVTFHNGIQQVFRVSKSDGNCNYAPQVDSQTGLAIGSWYHVVFYISNTQIKLYVNGVLEGSSVHTTPFDYQPGKEVFLGGTHESNFNLPFKGKMDEIRFYNRELTAQEVSTLYNSGGPCGLPVSSFSASRKSICKGEKIVFADQSTNNPTSWNWQIQGGTPATSSIANPTVMFSSPGVYTVSLTSSNGAGSGNTAVQTITVSECISIAENEAREIPTFYPNPSTGKLFYKNLKGMSFEIYDAVGSKAEFTQTQINDNTCELNMLGAPRGLYFVKVYNDKGEHIHTSKIIFSN